MKKAIAIILVIGCLLSTPLINVNAAPAEEESTSTTIKAIPKPCYGYIIPINLDDSFFTRALICRLINELLYKNILVYWTTSDITIKSRIFLKNEIRTNDFIKGSFIIPVNGTPEIDFNIISKLSKYKFFSLYPIDIYEIMEPIEDLRVYKLNEPNIAYHGGYPTYESAILWETYYFLLELGGFQNAKILTWDVIPDELNNKENEFDILVWGGGNSDDNCVIQKYFDQFNPAAITSIRNFIGDSGGYIGSCLGGYQIAQASALPFNWAKPFCPNIPSLMFLCFSARTVFPALPGTGEIYIKIIDKENPITYGLNEITTSWLAGGPIFLGPIGSTKTIGIFKDIDNEIFAWNNGIPPLFRSIWYEFTKKYGDIWVTKNFGNGKVIAFGDHPEYSFSSDRAVFNSVFYLAADEPEYVDIDKSKTFTKLDINTNGPYYATIFESINLKGTSNGWDPTFWYWNLGNLQETKTGQNINHTYYNPLFEDYKIVLIAGDENYNISYSLTFANITEVIVDNVPPNKPTTPDGFKTGKTGKEYYFQTYTTDNNFEDSFWYRIEVGDGINWDNITSQYLLTWETLWFVYNWSEPGEYELRVQAVDEHGAESEWSDPLIVNITSDENYNQQTQHAGSQLSCISTNSNLTNRLAIFNEYIMSPFISIFQILCKIK